LGGSGFSPTAAAGLVGLKADLQWASADEEHQVQSSGMAEASEFVLFGAAHLAALGVIVALAFGLAGASRAGLSVAAQGRLGLVLAFLLVAHEATKITTRVAVEGYPLASQLPLHLCALSALLFAWVLARRSYPVYEVVYFWAMGGTVQALLTPDLRDGFPHPNWLIFFGGHGLVMVGVAYATFVYGFRPQVRSILRSLAALAVVAALVMPVNAWLGTNFLYLMEKPGQASLLDYLGPWPWYIGSLAAVALLSSLVWYLPFAVADAWRARRRQRT
jgi:hypothetical integral membrane protein (TIGR02206 family)